VGGGGLTLQSSGVHVDRSTVSRNAPERCVCGGGDGGGECLCVLKASSGAFVCIGGSLGPPPGGGEGEDLSVPVCICCRSGFAFQTH
jgi:hypothetical protein